jgi:phosphatidylglycerol:prolipoprotein diacylglycerol transferase
MTVDQAQEFVVYAMIGVIVGGRILYLIADMLTPVSTGGHPISYYLQNPLEIIAIWHGGMAFHGGLIGAVVGTWLFLKRHKVAFYPLADEAAVWIPLAIALTRVANFINGELPGRITDSPIGMQFPGFEGYRYPSVLFEAAGMLVFVLPLVWLLHGLASRRPGLVWWAFIAGYGLVRTIVEFYREPGIVWFGLTAAQYLTIAMFVLGVVMMLLPPRPVAKAAVPAAVSASGKKRK